VFSERIVWYNGHSDVSSKMFALAYKKSAIALERSGKHIVMPGAQESLADYVRRVIRDKELSYRKVAARSGDEISASTISDIIKGRYSNLTARTQAALAKGLGVTLREVQAVIEGGPGDEDEFRQSILHMLHEKAKTASAEDKRFIDRTIKNLLSDLESNEAGKKAGSA